MSKISTAIELFLNNRSHFWVGVLRQYPFRIIPDALYSKLLYYAYMGKRLNPVPSTFYEKINWLKINYKDPLIRMCSDKYLVREFIQEQVGSEVLIPLIGTYRNAKEINFDSLPGSFVLKSSAGNGNNLIVRDKRALDVKKAVKKAKSWMREDYFWMTREWCYKDANPVIMCEQLLDFEGASPKDYKVYCFGGEPHCVCVFHDRFNENPSQTMYDTSWKVVPAVIHHHFLLNEKDIDPEPMCFSEMLDMSRKISRHFLHVRVDFYIIDNKPLIGELTFSSAAGCATMIPESMDEEIGNLLDLSMIDENGQFTGKER